MKDFARGFFIGLALTAVFLALLAAIARAAEQRCTLAEVRSFERMYPRGSVHCDPRTAKCIHYLGTTIKNGTCYIAVRPVS